MIHNMMVGHWCFWYNDYYKEYDGCNHSGCDL